MNIIRKHKIFLITNEPLTGRDKEIIDFIEDKLSNLIPYQHKDYPKSIFYMKDGKVLLEQDSKNDRLWCDYDGFWEVLSNMYNMGYEDIQTFIKYMVEQAFRQQVGSPVKDFAVKLIEVEQAFRQQLGTPVHKVGTPQWSTVDSGIEQAFRQQVGTPNTGYFYSNNWWNKPSDNR